MAYFYAGLGVALLVPLMALMQTLISVTKLDGEGDDSATKQDQKQVEIAREFRSVLEQAIPSRLQASLIDSNGKIPRLYPACADLPISPKPNEPKLIGTYYGTYPDCYAISTVLLANGAIRTLRIDLNISLDQGDYRRDLPLEPISRAIGVKSSCWVATVTQGCS